MVIVCQWLVSVIIKFRCLAPVMPIQNQTWTHQHTSRKWFIIRAFPGLIKETRTGVFIIDNPGTAPATDIKEHWLIHPSLANLPLTFGHVSPDLAVTTRPLRLDGHVARAAEARGTAASRHSGHVTHVTVGRFGWETVHPVFPVPAGML